MIFVPKEHELHLIFTDGVRRQSELTRHSRRAEKSVDESLDDVCSSGCPRLLLLSMLFPVGLKGSNNFKGRTILPAIII